MYARVELETEYLPRLRYKAASHSAIATVSNRCVDGLKVCPTVRIHHIASPTSIEVDEGFEPWRVLVELEIGPTAPDAVAETVERFAARLPMDVDAYRLVVRDGYRVVARSLEPAPRDGRGERGDGRPLAPRGERGTSPEPGRQRNRQPRLAR